jgi:DNA-binding transcriptional LysR family regulator
MGMSSMELRRLEHFVAVAEERSFTRASQRIRLVQSALSVSIKALEREVGVALFERTTHSVELTDAGRALLPEARVTLAAAQAAQDAVDSVVEGMRGTLTIGIMQSLSAIDLAALLTRFHRERPLVELRPRPTLGGSAELVKNVASGELDLAFIAVPAERNSGIAVIPLASEPILLAVPPGHRFASRDVVGVDELDGESFVEAPQGWGTRLVTDRALAAAGVRRDVTVEVGDLATLVELVRAGLGLGFIPQSTHVNANRVHLAQLKPALRWDVSLAVPSSRHQSAAARAFTTLVRESFPRAEQPDRRVT